MYDYDEAEMQLLEEHYQLMEVKLTIRHVPFKKKITENVHGRLVINYTYQYCLKS